MKHEEALRVLRRMNNNPGTLECCLWCSALCVVLVSPCSFSRLNDSPTAPPSPSPFFPRSAEFYSENRRVIVEFAVENAQRLQKHKLSREASKANNV